MNKYLIISVSIIFLILGLSLFILYNNRDTTYTPLKHNIEHKVVFDFEEKNKDMCEYYRKLIPNTTIEVIYINIPCNNHHITQLNKDLEDILMKDRFVYIVSQNPIVDIWSVINKKYQRIIRGILSKSSQTSYSKTHEWNGGYAWNIPSGKYVEVNLPLNKPLEIIDSDIK